MLSDLEAAFYFKTGWIQQIPYLFVINFHHTKTDLFDKDMLTEFTSYFFSEWWFIKPFTRYKYTEHTHSSSPVIHKVGNVGYFVLLKFENKIDKFVSHINFNSMGRDKI